MLPRLPMIFITPAKAGVQSRFHCLLAFAGMTEKVLRPQTQRAPSTSMQVPLMKEASSLAR